MISPKQKNTFHVTWLRIGTGSQLPIEEPLTVAWWKSAFGAAKLFKQRAMKLDFRRSTPHFSWVKKVFHGSKELCFWMIPNHDGSSLINGCFAYLQLGGGFNVFVFHLRKWWGNGLPKQAHNPRSISWRWQVSNLDNSTFFGSCIQKSSWGIVGPHFGDRLQDNVCFRRLKRNMGRFKKRCVGWSERYNRERERESTNEERTESRKDPPTLPCLFAFQEGRSMRTESRSWIICIEVAEPLYVVEAAFQAKDLFLPDDPHCGPYYWARDGCSHWLGRPPGARLEPWSRCWWPSKHECHALQGLWQPATWAQRGLEGWRVHFHTSRGLQKNWEQKNSRREHRPGPREQTSGEKQTQSIWLAVCQIKVVGMKSASREYSISSFPSSWLVSYPSFLALYPIMSVNRCWNPPWERLLSGAPAQRPWNTAIRFHRAVFEVSYIGNLSIKSYFNCMMAAEIKSEPHDSQNKVTQNISGRGPGAGWQQLTWSRHIDELREAYDGSKLPPLPLSQATG